MKTVTLASGHEMPLVGLGTWDLRGRKCKRVIQEALAIGYTHIDTAWMYENQRAIGDAQGADQGDTAMLAETVTAAAEQVAAVAQDQEANEQLSPRGLQEVVADKGYHSNEVLTDLTALELRSYISEPDRGPRKWGGKRLQQQALYGNRRRMRGERGKRLSRLRGARAPGDRARTQNSQAAPGCKVASAETNQAEAMRFSRNTRGCRAATRSKASAGPSGLLRPCSQLRSV